MRPFLLLATRAEDVAAQEEYEAFLEFGGLDAAQLERRRLEREPLGAVNLDDYAGVILGGSPFTISDEDKPDVQVRVETELVDLTQRALAVDFPFLGACFGIGIIGAAVGGTVDRTYGEDVSAPTITLTEAGQVDPLFNAMPREFAAFVGHKEAVHSLPPDVVVLASSPLCPVQAFRVGKNVYATQFHPELDVPGIHTRIDAYKDHGYFPPEEADDLKAMAEKSDVRPDVLGRLIKRFVELYGDADA
ncbi:MAG TPA: glutamine amidotransferase [Aeromicrobium sp.]|nr:glutamine amidotransferase [Aeromicrobium sp.]